MDPGRLRATLDSLRAGLERPFFTTSGISLVHEHDKLLVAVSGTLDALVRVDAGASRALSAVQSVFRPESDASHLRDLLSVLGKAWHKSVRSRLGSKVRVLREFLDDPAPDMLSILSCTTDENAHSDVLAWLLDPKKAKFVAPHSLAALVSTAGLEPQAAWQDALSLALRQSEISVRREYRVSGDWAVDDSENRIDLLVSGPDFVLAIENKIFSGEGDRQTERYWRLMQHIRRPLKGGIFLSPSGFSPRNANFKAVSYLDLVSCHLEAPSRESDGLRTGETIVLSGYIKTLASRILRTELRAACILEADDA